MYWDYASALEHLTQATYPLVGKLCHGTDSHNVCMIRDYEQGKRYVDMLFDVGTYDLWQQGLRVRGIRGRLAVAWRPVLWGGAIIPPTRWRAHKHYALFQEFIPNNEGDTRVVVIGRRTFACQASCTSWAVEQCPGHWERTPEGRIEWREGAVTPEQAQFKAFERRLVGRSIMTEVSDSR